MLRGSSIIKCCQSEYNLTVFHTGGLSPGVRNLFMDLKLLRSDKSCSLTNDIQLCSLVLFLTKNIYKNK